MDYEEALEISNPGLDGFVGQGLAFLQEPVSPEVLSRIRQGAAVSPRIPEGCREILIRHGLIEP